MGAAVSRRSLALIGLAWAIGVLVASGLGARPLHSVLGWLLHTGPGLGAAALVVCSAVLWGRPLVERLTPGVASGDAITRDLVALALGLAVLQTAAVLLGLAGVLSRPVAVLLLVAPLVAMRWWRQPEAVSPSPAAGASPAWWLVGGALLLPSILEIGAPMLAPDEGQYHRRLVEHVLQTGGFHLDAEDGPSGFAQGMHALGALAAHVGGLGALRPLGWLLGLAGLLTGERIAARRFGPVAAGWTMAVGCGAATLLRVLPTFNTDLALAPLIGVAAIVVLDLHDRPDGSPRRALSLAVIGGAALSIKYTAPLFIGPLVVVAAVSAARAGRRRLVASLAAAAVLPLLFALPWLVRNAATFGHPLFPFFGLEAPPGGDPDAWAFNFTSNYGPGGAGAAVARSPWDLFVLGREFDRRLFLGRLNPWPLAAIPGLLIALRERVALRGLAAAVVLMFLAWAVGLRRVVYLLPAWPLIAALTAGGLAALVDALAPSWRRAAGAALGAALVLVGAAEVAAPWPDQLEAAGVACGRESPQEWSEERLPAARVLRWLEDHGAEDETVAMFWGWHAWGLPGRVIWIGAEEYTPLRARLVRLGTPEAVRDELHRLDVRWLVHRRVYFQAEAYPMIEPGDFEAAFTRPLALTDEVLDCCATRRFSHGPLSVYELAPRAD